MTSLARATGLSAGVALALLLLLGMSCTSRPGPLSPAAPTETPRFVVTFQTGAGQVRTLRVEIADTPEERARGLMGRRTLAEDAGMLFVWTEDTESGFWMKDTFVPLSIAFIDAAGTILDIEDMQPLDETLHYSPVPYRYAVEANQGWFRENGVEPGGRAVLPEGVEVGGEG